MPPYNEQRPGELLPYNPPFEARVERLKNGEVIFGSPEHLAIADVTEAMKLGAAIVERRTLIDENKGKLRDPEPKDGTRDLEEYEARYNVVRETQRTRCSTVKGYAKIRSECENKMVRYPPYQRMLEITRMLQELEESSVDEVQ